MAEIVETIPVPQISKSRGVSFQDHKAEKGGYDIMSGLGQNSGKKHSDEESVGSDWFLALYMWPLATWMCNFSGKKSPKNASEHTFS